MKVGETVMMLLLQFGFVTGLILALHWVDRVRTLHRSLKK